MQIPSTPVAEMTLVQRCMEDLRQLILTGELLPGETLRQATLAERLGASRIPVREALTSLQAEGVVTYVPRLGFAVARFNSDELREIYLMRALLERELLCGLEMTRADPAHLEHLNDALEQLVDVDSLWEHKRLNREFHFSLFALAPMPTVQAEVERLWNMSEFYRSLYAYEPDSRRRIVDEHRRIIAAVRAQDRERLLAEVDAHRVAALDAITSRLGPAHLANDVRPRSSGRGDAR
jgi:DNA-binding GntR family transcriptional regulator